MGNGSSRSNPGDDVRIVLPPIHTGSDDSIEEFSSDGSELASGKADPLEIVYLVDRFLMVT